MRNFIVAFILILTISAFSLNIVTSIKPLELIARELAPNSNIYNIYDNYDTFLNLKVESKDFKNADLMIVLNNEIIINSNINKVILSEGVLFYPYKENPFIWSDPLYSVVIAYKIEKKLENIDPQNASEYRDNLLNFTQKIIELSDEFSKSIKNKKISIIDINNLFTHFYERYGIDYKIYNDKITITSDKVLVANYNYKNTTYNNLKNKKVLVDIFASKYNNIINFYKSIIDNLLN
ncbi:metal ABC transporter solute-binding protein, Zn/Mn family [Marinitoga aeolica]|uniref:Zinc ABC transporter substrate-binding protein n=1 Tax=Marinitoga aeolica TaxID=2809031 RepID=A0ABY8PQS2_9BACT|nr:zinc ABC transporter substrate-binding protein [Marinitoga aeolica]WGS64962.1 zinc ABC transporter substrate-binding protein [Marinitoga aeolica]